MLPRPKAGQDASPIVDSATVWTDLADLLNAYKSGRLGVDPNDRTVERQIWIKNDTGRSIVAGEILQISPLSPPSSALSESFYESPTFSAVEPTWHSDIDNLVVAFAAAPAGEMIAYAPRSWATVALSSATTGDRYVMVDPDNPARMKTATSGIFHALGVDAANSKAIVDLTRSEPRWRYRLTEGSKSPDTTAAKLIRSDGTEFSSTEIALSDPLSIGNGDTTDYEGYCVQAGNEFHIASGPC